MSGRSGTDPAFLGAIFNSRRGPGKFSTRKRNE